jgi:putative beta-lysine N-acetyltransferase
MQDCIEILRHSKIQHGSLNGRIYVIELDSGDVPVILSDLDSLAHRKGYTKIVVKVPVLLRNIFTDAGYLEEARIPGFFGGRDAVVFMSKFLNKTRLLDRRLARHRSMLTAIEDKASSPPRSAPPAGLAVVRCGPDQTEPLSCLFRQVFESYPFPVDDPVFLRSAMQRQVDYYAIERGGELVAAAAAEKNVKHGSVEMTDFAVLPAWRARGLGARLLAVLEYDMANQGLKTAFSIARAASWGMNAVFGKLGYRYGGLLVNNTHIAGCIESMIVWYKPLSAIDAARG